MHLKQLKLAGFKSFVEPTVLPFPSQLIGVVGPNGCGKSNVIDAVRWVLGESSAKNLRGESMIDVIFNGSAHRKSVGQASVELVFDNSLGRLIGQYASYQEIAVKRLLTRDGESYYFLNGSRCRRRDIQDLFLGTGSGPRGYAIIGQEMISRMVDARPSELKAYLEEAAGVSKYKDRRRETLQRIEQTYENLARVSDIRDELKQHLTRLERQAQSAERFKTLKAQERRLRQELLALKWRAMQCDQNQVEDAIQQLLMHDEAHQARLCRLNRESESKKQALNQAREAYQETQTLFYQRGNEIARLEEAILQQCKEKARVLEDKLRTETDYQAVTTQLAQDIAALAVSEERVEALQERMSLLKARLNEQQEALENSTQQERLWNEQSQAVLASQSEARHDVEMARVRIESLDAHSQQTLIRLEKLNHQLAQIETESLNVSLAELKTEHSELLEEKKAVTDHALQIEGLEKELEGTIQDYGKRIRALQDEIQNLSTEHAILQAAQNSAYHRLAESNGSSKWQNYARVLDEIQVSEPWLNACELVLGESLRAVLLDSFEDILPNLAELKDSALVFVKSSSNLMNESRKNMVTALAHADEGTEPSITLNHSARLSDYVQGVTPCWLNRLDKIYAVEHLHDALKGYPHLSSDESIITPDGFWLGSDWIRAADFSKLDQSGLLIQKQRLEQLTEALTERRESLQRLQHSREQCHNRLGDLNNQAQRLRQNGSENQQALQTCHSRIHQYSLALEHAHQESRRLTQDIEEQQMLLETLAEQKQQVETQKQSANERVQLTQRHDKQLRLDKEQWAPLLQACREQVREMSQTLQETELQFERERLMTQQLKNSIEREKTRSERFNQHLNLLEERLHALNRPEGTLQADLNEQLAAHHQLEIQLNAHREVMDGLSQAIKDLAVSVKEESLQEKLLQAQIQEKKMQAHALTARMEDMLLELKESEIQLDTLSDHLFNELSLQKKEQALCGVLEKIKQLGAVNLVAIEEFQTESQRKQYLDEQYQDLNEALSILEDAVAKMDQETKLRLQETFDQMNQAFQNLFPRLFGGGYAKLELSSDDLLEAGVSIIARPPGKRNSTLQMLSGGEKAMTAVALLFAIFQLNPAPFCMLDEVDAPLDDANVRRLCDLIKEMAQSVQFLFITHNKITMELAEHLIGVTMKEPGVSRLVSVDVDRMILSK